MAANSCQNFVLVSLYNTQYTPKCMRPSSSTKGTPKCPSVRLSVRLSVRPSVRPCFPDALRYQFEIWYMHSVGGTTCRVWVASQLLVPIFSCDQAALQRVFSVFPSVSLEWDPCDLHVLSLGTVHNKAITDAGKGRIRHYVLIIVSSWNFQEL